ncbi:hypothetical protein AGMMS49525_14000 [Bacteroidia bacterium]|nr:hypothetical protein AGMMS49525_14000 [Bacteroidia bacterium]
MNTKALEHKDLANSEILLYQLPDGDIKIDVRMEDDTVWLTQDQMSLLFNKSKSTINEHIKNIYAENELIEDNTVRKFGISEFSTKPTNFYNLDVTISVGYRVKSVCLSLSRRDNSASQSGKIPTSIGTYLLYQSQIEFQLR